MDKSFEITLLDSPVPMDKLHEEQLKRSFGKKLLDTPVPNIKIKFFPTEKGLKSRAFKVLPDPELKPTEYVPPRPERKPKPKIPFPTIRRVRKYQPKPKEERIQKTNDEIAPYYKKEAITALQKNLSDRKSLREIVTEKGRALKNSVKSFQVAIIERGDPAKQLYVTTIDVERKLKGLLGREKGLKVYVTLHITFKKRKIEDSEGIFEFKNAYFNSKTFTITNSDHIIDALDQASEEIKNGVAVWLSEGSGWTIEEILGHYINIVKYVPLRGNSYLPLPEELRNPRKG